MEGFTSYIISKDNDFFNSQTLTIHIEFCCTFRKSSYFLSFIKNLPSSFLQPRFTASSSSILSLKFLLTIPNGRSRHIECGFEATIDMVLTSTSL